MMWQVLAILLMSFGSYYGTRWLFPSTACNRDLQDFVLNDVPIYWKVIEGMCRPNDPDYSHVEYNVEELLVEDEGDWPDAICQYGEILGNRYIFVYGTNEDAVNTIDCYEPVKEIEEDMLEHPEELLKGWFS